MYDPNLDPFTGSGQLDPDALRRIADQAGGPIPYPADGEFYRSPVADVYLPPAQKSSSTTVTFSGARVAIPTASPYAAPYAAVGTINTWATGIALFTYDTDGYFNAATPSLLTAPKDGYYVVGCSIYWQDDTNATGIRQLILDSLVDTRGPVGASYRTSQHLTDQPRKAAKGDTFAVQVYQTTSSAFSTLNIGDCTPLGGLLPATHSMFWIRYVGA